MKTILDRLASAEASLHAIVGELSGASEAEAALIEIVAQLEQFREDLPDLIWGPIRDDGGEPCQDCPMCQRWDEPYQIGDRTEYEPMSECQATTPHSCPHVQQILTGTADQVPAFLRRQAE